MSAAAGWYTDPHAPTRWRYFDGRQWTEHVHPGPTSGHGQIIAGGASSSLQAWQQVQHVQVNQVQLVTQGKSVGVALLLTFFFGPLGMLYSTVVGGLVMFGLAFVLGPLTLGLWFLVAWPIQMIWAGVAASRATVSPASVTIQQVPPHHAGPSGPWTMTQALPSARPDVPPAPLLPPSSGDVVHPPDAHDGARTTSFTHPPVDGQW